MGINTIRPKVCGLPNTVMWTTEHHNHIVVHLSPEHQRINPLLTPGCRDLLKMDTDVGNKVLTCDGVVVGDLCRSSASTANWEIESFMDLAFTKTVAPPHRFGGAVRGL